MNRKIILFTYFIFVFKILFSYDSNFIPGITNNKNPWQGFDKNTEKTLFRFAVVGDRTGAMQPGVFKEAIYKLNLISPDLVLSVGDFIHGYTKDKNNFTAQFNQFDAIISNLSMPFFYTVGNHDVSYPVMNNWYLERYGSTYYHFLYKNILFLVLSTEDPSYSTISTNQILYAQKVLKKNTDVRWTYVFLHKPAWLYQSRTNFYNSWLSIEKDLKNRNYTVFAGHEHQYRKYEKNNAVYIRMGTTGGGRADQGRMFGFFDHFMLVTIKESGPVFANILFDCLDDENISSEDNFLNYSNIYNSAKVVIPPIEKVNITNNHLNNFIEIKNEADIPLKYKHTITSKNYTGAFPSVLEIFIAPHKEKKINYSIYSLIQNNNWKDNTVSLNYSLIYEQDLAYPIIREASGNVGVIAVNYISQIKTKYNPDGNLEEWGNLGYICENPAQILSDPSSYSGSDDCRYSFDITYNKQNVYFAVRVYDDNLFFDSSKRVWQQDGIEIRIDKRPDYLRYQFRPIQDYEIFPILVSPGNDNTEQILHRPETFPAGTVVHSTVHNDGYSIEIAIPIKYFFNNNKKIEEFRFNICVDDYDADNSGAQLWWQPDWRTKENLHNSGTFRFK